MRLYFLMFITADCFLFLLKLRWPRNKSIILRFRMGYFRDKKKEEQINSYVQTEPQTHGYENRGILST